MATSGSKTINVTSYDTLKFSWSVASQSVANNTSTVNWTLTLSADSSGYINSTASKTWKVTIAGQSYSGTNTVGIANNANKTLASGTTTISHNSDGTKTFNYAFSQEFDITFSGSKIGTKTGSGSGTLDTIPRKSTLSVGNGTLGTAQTLTITRATSSFKHKLKYFCGDAEGYILGSSSSFSTSTSVSWTPPLSLAAENTTGTSVSIKFTLYTYTDSGDGVGTNSYTKTFSIPSSVKPTVSISVSDANGYLADYGQYIAGKSAAKVTVTASGSQGSTIKSYKTTVDGGSYTSASFTSNVLKSAGTLTVETTVTDSRGRTATASTNISVLEYTKPQITAFSTKRCDSDGTANSAGAYLCVTFSARVEPLATMNTATYKVMYKKVTASSYTTVTLTSYKDDYSVTDGTYIFLADTSSSYDVDLSITDDFETITKSGSGSSTTKVFSILKRGLGWAFGKVAELENTLDVNFFSRFRKNITMDGGDGASGVGGMYGIDPTTLEEILALQLMNENGNTALGYGNYVRGKGDTNVYGNDVWIYPKTVGGYKPYYSAGDSVTMTIRTAGYITSSGAALYFVIPLGKPVLGSPTVTLTSGDGFILRHNGSYTNGSSSSTYIKPSSYTGAIIDSGISVSCRFSSTTNVTNNDVIGIIWNGTITFS